jgi:hypothetical protein
VGGSFFFPLLLLHIFMMIVCCICGYLALDFVLNKYDK